MTDALKLRLPMLVVAGLLSTVAAAAGTWAISSERLAQSGARIDRVETKQEAAEREAEAQRLRTQRLEDALVNMSDIVKEIRQDVKDIKRR